MTMKLKHAVIIGLALGAAAAAIWHMSRPLPVSDGTPMAIEEGRSEVAEAVRDADAHNEKTVREVRVIRETMAQSVAALDPDGLVLSVDEFIGRWRGYSGESQAGAAGLGGPD
jgi:PAS domain-containing protein